MKIVPRQYQIATVNSIKLNTSNICVLCPRSGKSFIAKLIIDTPNIKKKYNRLIVFNPIYNKKYTIGISFLSYVRTDVDSSEYNKLLKWARLIVNTQGRFIEQ